MKRIALLIFLIGLPLISVAQYRWLDADGKVSYGDAPPPSAKDVQPVGRNATGRGETSDPTFPYELRVAAERFPVTLYTSAKCAPCEQARNFLRTRGVPYTEKTVRYKEELEQMERNGLGNTFPVATIGRTTKKGFLAADWAAELSAAGYPEQSKLPPQWKPTRSEERRVGKEC